MAKPKVNYWVDLLIGVAFTVSAASGLVSLLPVGSDSGRVLGLSYRVWDELHLWGSLALIAGVLTHLVLHARWIACMTQKTLSPGRRQTQEAACPVPADGSVVSRRRFLMLGAGTLVVGAILTGGSVVVGALTKALESVGSGDGGKAPVLKSAVEKGGVTATASGVSAQSETNAVEPMPAQSSDEVSPEDAAPTQEATTEAEVAVDPTATPVPSVRMCVACRKGQVNDPYPGRCHDYVDRDNDGLCDNSIPTACE